MVGKVVLEFLKDKECNAESRLDKKIIWKFYEQGFVDTAQVRREYHYIDIHILVRTKEKILPVIIENKVKSHETGEQTDEYFNYCEKVYQDRDYYYEPIYVYLVPEFNKNKKPTNKNFLIMSYQELVENVIEPSMAMCKEEVSKNNMRLYLQCLSYQDDDKGGTAMAISNEERKILSDFIEENRNLLISVLNELSSDVDESVITKMTGAVRDYSKYLFNGVEYSKSRLVLAVVKQYVNDLKPVDYNSLLEVFPDSLQGTNRGVVRLADDVRKTDKGNGGKKRYFVEDGDIIRLPSGQNVLVCNQWGIDNISSFIEHVSKRLNYRIQKI